jgi:serine/threonine protein kinase
MSLASGTQIGPYRIVSAIGSGGMGKVWLAQDTRLERHVAIKVLPLELTTNPAQVRRFEQEARAASSLNHANVCTIHALGETPDGRQFIAMELVEGTTLRARLSRGAGGELELAPRLEARVAAGGQKIRRRGTGDLHRSTVR